MNSEELKTIFKLADNSAEIQTFLECGENVMIYPCGFAWVTLNNGIRGKRNPLGKELKALGLMDYDEYRKCYYLWITKYNQSLQHKEAHAKYMAEILTDKIGVNFDYGSKFD